ncbi:hypothetical protein HUC12_07380 [Escherichia coli]|nr:hypothetical protein [Escherichia coli]NUE62715.1 hypothetical protein [Escherichia coli]
MKIKDFLFRIKKKAFATYEYNERFNKIESQIFNMSKSNEQIVALLDNTNSRIENLQSELLNAMHHESSSVKSNFQVSVGKLEELQSTLTSNKMVLNSISKNTKEITIKKPKILFLVNNLNAWHAIAGLVDELKKTDHIEVIVASINKKFPGQSTYEGESDVHAFLLEQRVHHIRLGMQDSYQALDILISISPDVIFRQSQWDADYPPALTSENLNFTKLAIVPYGISNIIKNANYTGDIKDSAVDSPYHRRSWRTYCSSEYVKLNAIANGSMDGRQFMVVGHPKIEYLLSVKPLWPFSGNGSKKILWSPHHSITKGWSDFGMFPWIWRDMLSLAQTMKEIDFVFCPHPALVTQLTGEMSPIPDGEYEEFITTWDSLSNCHSYYGAEYAEIASASDLVITDGISMLMECQFLQKDIIFMEREGHSEFNNIGKILSSGFYTEKDVSGMKEMIVKYFSGELPSLRKNQIENVEKLFPTRDSAINIAKDIISSIKNP